MHVNWYLDILKHFIIRLECIVTVIYLSPKQYEDKLEWLQKKVA